MADNQENAKWIAETAIRVAKNHGRLAGILCVFDPEGVFEWSHCEYDMYAQDLLSVEINYNEDFETAKVKIRNALPKRWGPIPERIMRALYYQFTS